jgi:hypothetical protein
MRLNGWMERGDWDGLNSILPFWNFIVGDQTGVVKQALDIVQ